MAWGWAGFYILVAILLPAGYVVWLVWGGQVTDIDLRCREQRQYPFIVTLVSTLAAWLVLYGVQAPSELVLLTGAGWVQIALLLAITLRWKISAHCALAASFVVWLWAVFGAAAAPFVLIIPLVAWSRLRLKRHNLPQTIAGALLGSTVLAITLYLVG
jgi:membrane-associated phospholipid phosphatase